MRAIALPVKRLDEAKSRLSSLLAPLERGALTLAMLEDVLDATLAMPGWATIVVSPDESVLEVAARRGAVALAEERPPLAAAIHQVEEEASARGLDALRIDQRRFHVRGAMVWVGRALRTRLTRTVR